MSKEYRFDRAEMRGHVSKPKDGAILHRLAMQAPMNDLIAQSIGGEVEDLLLEDDGPKPHVRKGFKKVDIDWSLGPCHIVFTPDEMNKFEIQIEAREVVKVHVWRDKEKQAWLRFTINYSGDGGKVQAALEAVGEAPGVMRVTVAEQEEIPAGEDEHEAAA